MWPLLLQPILPSLGYAVLSSLWQAALLWLLYVVLVRCLQPTAAQRYRLASIASAGALFLFLLSVLLAPIKSAPLPVSAMFGAATVPLFYRLLPALGIGYILLAAWQMVRLVMGWQQVQRLRNRHTSKAPLDWRLFVTRYSAYMGIKKPVQLILSNRISSPLTIGFWKPVILFPVASVNQLTLAQAEAILIHELAHIRRADYLLNYLLQLAGAILFFNPFHRLLLQSACRDREISCDEWVLQYNYNRRDYAEALLQVEKMALVPAFAMAAASQPGFELLHRIRLMLVPGTAPVPATRQRLLWWPTALLLLALGLQLVMPALQHTASGLPKGQRAGLLSRLRPVPAPYDFLIADAVRHENNAAFNAEATPTPENAMAEVIPQPALNADLSHVNLLQQSSDPTENRWLQPVKDLLNKGQTVLKATDALPAAAMEAELRAQLEAATAEMQLLYEQQLLNAQVLAAEDANNAARAKELEAAQAALQATSANLQKLSAALAGQLVLEKKKSKLTAALPLNADQSNANTAAVAAPTNRSYQFSYNEVSESPLEIPLFSPKASWLPNAEATDRLAQLEETSATPMAEKKTLQLPIIQPDRIRARVEREIKSGLQSLSAPKAKPRVVISL